MSQEQMSLKSAEVGHGGLQAPMNRSGSALRWVIPAVVALSASLVTFGGLAEEVGEREWQRWDSATALLSRNHTFRPLMAFWSLIGGGAPLLLIGAVLIAFLVTKRRRMDAAFVAAALVGSFALSQGLKDLFNRPRPAVATYAFHVSVPTVLIGLAIAAVLVRPTRWRRALVLAAAVFALLVAVDHDVIREVFHNQAKMDSFPSGHALSSMSFAAAAVVVGWRTRFRWSVAIAGAIFVHAVGLSRVYLGFHYPSDVVAGWSLALAWVILLAVILHPGVVRSVEESRDQPRTDRPLLPSTE
jgi:membrane-associated phospholipid phosphatase